ncbi:MAG: hypothetical protein U9N59_13630 [Campylobacterota bacterium]|nr:hypothetical protein [Campylobacterota bacterium]
MQESKGDRIIEKRFNLKGTMWRSKNKFSKMPPTQLINTLPTMIEFELVGTMSSPEEVIIEDSTLKILSDAIGEDLVITGYSFPNNFKAETGALDIHIGYKSMSDKGWKKLKSIPTQGAETDTSNVVIDKQKKIYKEEISIEKVDKVIIENKEQTNMKEISKDMKQALLMAFENKKIKTISRFIYLIGIKCEFDVACISDVTKSCNINEDIVDSIIYAFSILLDDENNNKIIENDENNDKVIIDMNDKILQKFKYTFSVNSKIDIVNNKIVIGEQLVTKDPNIYDDILDNMCDFIIKNNFIDISLDDINNLISDSDDLNYLLENGMISSDDNLYSLSLKKENFDNEFQNTIDNKVSYLSTTDINKNNDIYQMMIDFKLIKSHRHSDKEIGKLTETSRQTIGMQWTRFKKSFYPNIDKELLRNIKFNLNKNKILHISDLPFDDNKYSYILATFLSLGRDSTNRIYDYNHKLDALILDDSYSYENILSKIVNLANEQKIIKFKFIEINNLILEILPNTNAGLIIKSLEDNNDLIKIENGYYILQKQYPNNAHKVELVYMLHPNEKGYKKDEYQLVEDILNRYFPDSFKDLKPKNLKGYCSRSEDLLLWERGGYFIHKNNIQHILNGYDFDNLLSLIDNKLSATKQISIKGFFDDGINKKSLENNEIYNEHALHSLLELKYPDRYKYLKSPDVARPDSDIKNQKELLLSIMKKDTEYTLSSLSETMNTKDRIPRQLIDRTIEVVAIKKDVYKLRKYLDKEKNEEFECLIANIVKYINDIIEQYKFIYPSLIVNKFKNELHNHLHSYHNTEYILLSILKKLKTDNKFQVIQNSRIVSKNYLDSNNLEKSISEKLNYHSLVKDNLFKNKKELKIDELKDFFEIRGLDYQNFLINYRMIDDDRRSIVRIEKKIFIEIDSLFISDKALTKLNQDVEKEVKKGIEDISQILVNVELPNISNLYSWNNYLLHDILSSDFVKTQNTPEVLKLKENNRRS